MATNKKYQPRTRDELKALCDDLSIHLGDIDTSLITDMSYLFDGVTRESLDGIETWNVSNVKNMDWMFACVEATIPYLGKWDVSNLESAEAMFKSSCFCAGKTLVDWTPKSLKNRTYMFEKTRDVSDLDVRSWRIYLPNVSQDTLWELTGDSVEDVGNEMSEAFSNIGPNTFSLFETLAGFKYKHYTRMFLLSCAEEIFDEATRCGQEAQGYERDTDYLMNKNAKEFLEEAIGHFVEENIPYRAFNTFDQEAFLIYKDIFDFIRSGEYAYPVEHLTKCCEDEFASNFDSIQDGIIEEYLKHCVELGVLDKEYVDEIIPFEPAVEGYYARCECGYESRSYPTLEDAVKNQGEVCPDCEDDLDIVPESYKNEED